ncbi:MAG TPA: hypothetical protein VMS38_25010 [Pseudorhodoferax sp.]|jgi:hypothetical protein|nr:hypothetical protein [Pseudorhodoferax sp.]
MPRKLLNHVQYLAELNQRLWADPDFRDGMAFRLYPDGKIAGHLRDAEHVGSCTIPTVFARIEAQVAQAYELALPAPQHAWGTPMALA